MYWLCAVLDGVVVCGGRMGAVRIPAPDAAERTKLLEDLHDRHFFALQVLSGGVPLHQVAEVLLAERAALGRLEVIHQREDALVLRGVSCEARGVRRGRVTEDTGGGSCLLPC